MSTFWEDVISQNERCLNTSQFMSGKMQQIWWEFVAFTAQGSVWKHHVDIHSSKAKKLPLPTHHSSVSRLSAITLYLFTVIRRPSDYWLGHKLQSMKGDIVVAIRISVGEHLRVELNLDLLLRWKPENLEDRRWYVLGLQSCQSNCPLTNWYR